jgi:hypothetical protein
MKNNTEKINFEEYLQSQKCRVTQYVNESKVFWKNVAKHYKRISNEL